MSDIYVKNILKAIENPLPELKATFNAEFELLKSNIKKNYTVIDVGSGTGRPADILASYCKKLLLLDNSELMIEEAMTRIKGIDNIEIVNGDALNMSFSENSFDLTYATYNLIGSIEKNQRQILVNEMRRVAKQDSKIINITWKDDDVTTKFLKKYYPSIGIDIIEVDDSKTITSKGIFERISRNDLLDYYQSANLNKVEFFDVGPVWLAIIGVK